MRWLQRDGWRASKRAERGRAAQAAPGGAPMSTSDWYMLTRFRLAALVASHDASRSYRACRRVWGGGATGQACAFSRSNAVAGSAPAAGPLPAAGLEPHTSSEQRAGSEQQRAAPAPPTLRNAVSQTVSLTPVAGVPPAEAAAASRM